MIEGIVLAGTTEGLWDVVTGRCLHFEGREVRSLARGNSGHLAIIDGQQVWLSASNGEWVQIASLETLKATSLFSTATDLFVGTSESRLFSLRDQTLEPVHSFATVQGRENWYTPWGGPPEVRSISADPSGTLYVNVHVGGIARSNDAGESWQPTIDIDADVHQVLHHPGSGLLLAATGVGLAISADGGESWQFHTDGLHGTYLRAVAVAGHTILITASTGPSTRKSAVYRRAVTSGEPFKRCRRGLPEWFSDNIDTFCLTALDSLVAFGTTDGQVFLSSNEGQDWDRLAEDLPRVLCVAIASME